MSATSDERNPQGDLDELPEFDLHCHVDDPDDPAEVTVYPANREEKLAEQWLTIEKGFVLPIEEVR